MATPIVIVARQGESGQLERGARLERACELIVDAGLAGAGWVLFPEAYLPGAPAWLWSAAQAGALASELGTLAEAVEVPSATTERLCRVARRSQVGVAIGVIERAGGACYSSLLLIDAQGRICGHHRSALPAWSLVADEASPASVALPEWAGGI